MSKRGRVEAFLHGSGVDLIDLGVWERLRQIIGPVSDSYLRKLVRASGIAMAPMVEGVCQGSLPELERTLIALQHDYESENAETRRKCRALVIAAKDHARWALRKGGIDPDRKAIKDEMLLWMLTWLENPVIFASWLAIRKR